MLIFAKRSGSHLAREDSSLPEGHPNSEECDSQLVKKFQEMAVK